MYATRKLVQSGAADAADVEIMCSCKIPLGFARSAVEQASRRRGGRAGGQAGRPPNMWTCPKQAGLEQSRPR